MEANSKIIMSLKGKEDEPLGASATKLQLNVRAYTISYIRDLSATLPTLPDKQQLTQLVSQKDEERKRKVERQLQQARVS